MSHATDKIKYTGSQLAGLPRKDQREFDEILNEKRRKLTEHDMEDLAHSYARGYYSATYAARRYYERMR